MSVLPILYFDLKCLHCLAETNGLAIPILSEIIIWIYGKMVCSIATSVQFIFPLNVALFAPESKQ